MASLDMTEKKKREAQKIASADVDNGFFPAQNPFNFIQEAEQFMEYLRYGFDCQTVPQNSSKDLKKRLTTKT